MLELTQKLGSFLFLQVRIAHQPPATYRISWRRLYTLLWIVGIILNGLLVGSLLFFREIEINRKLTERILELETTFALVTNTRTVPTSPVDEIKTDPVTGTRDPSATAQAVIAPVAQVAPPPLVTARLGELSAECIDSICDIRAILVPRFPGLAQGSLALVLEVEVSRIGVADPNAPSRKQFVYYPGLTALDNFNIDLATDFEKKSFRFARALPTNVSFEVGKLNTPIAINVYIFDKENNLVLHERKSLEQ